jgi:hypothetical protein
MHSCSTKLTPQMCREHSGFTKNGCSLISEKVNSPRLLMSVSCKEDMQHASHWQQLKNSYTTGKRFLR